MIKNDLQTSIDISNPRRLVLGEMQTHAVRTLLGFEKDIGFSFKLVCVRVLYRKNLGNRKENLCY